MIGDARRCSRAHPAVPAELQRAWSVECELWFGPGQRTLPNAPHKTNLALVETPLGPAVAKRERPEGWRGGLARVHARRWRSIAAFDRGIELAAAGLATPEPLAVLVRSGLAQAESLLVTRYVDALPLWDFARSVERDVFLALLARDLAALHAKGFRHRDLKASNLLVRRDDPAIVWTDLDGLRRHETTGSWTRVRDLSRLAMSFESSAARAAGIRAGAWPALVCAYLERSLGRAPENHELERFLAGTRAASERRIRANLVRGRVIT